MRSLFATLLVFPLVAFATDKPVPSSPSQSQNQGQHQGQDQAQGQSQGQYQDASASAQNGLSLTYKGQLQIPHAPAPTAPAVYASGPCNTGDSRAITTPIGGVSKGKSSTDDNCNRREAARVLTPLNPGLALKVMCSDPYVAAVATPEDCVYVPTGTSTVTRADLDRVEQETSKKIDTAFKQSQSK
jgi:hypothetical protein